MPIHDRDLEGINELAVKAARKITEQKTKKKELKRIGMPMDGIEKFKNLNVVSTEPQAPWRIK